MTHEEIQHEALLHKDAIEEIIPYLEPREKNFSQMMINALSVILCSSAAENEQEMKRLDDVSTEWLNKNRGMMLKYIQAGHLRKLARSLEREQDAS